MKRFAMIPAMLLIASCGSSSDDELASGTFDDGEGNEGSYSIRGDEESSETVIKSGDGEVRIATGDKALKELPLGIELYPGADVQTSMSGIGEGKSGAMVVFKTSDSADDVVKFYRDQMAEKGIEVKTEVTTGNMKMIGGERDSGETVNLSVSRDIEGEGVTATLIAGG